MTQKKMAGGIIYQQKTSLIANSRINIYELQYLPNF